jgi:hypothetical protein
LVSGETIAVPLIDNKEDVVVVVEPPPVGFAPHPYINNREQESRRAM